MKYLLMLLFVVSCASAPQPKEEPWDVGDCVVNRPRGWVGKIDKIYPPSETGKDEYFYGIQIIAEEKKDKVLEIIPCPAEQK